MRRAAAERFGRWRSAGARWRRRRSATRREGRGWRGPGGGGRLRLRARRRRGAALAGLRAGLAGRSRGGSAGVERGGRRVRAHDAHRAGLARRHRRGAATRACARVWRELRERPLPLLDPAPAGRFQVASAMPPEHFEARRRARGRADRRPSELQKIVLAREVQVHAPQDVRSGGGAGRAARGVPLVLRVLRRARRRGTGGGQPRAAGAPRGPPREHAGARRLDAPLGRPGRRRPPRRAAVTRRGLPRGARDRRAAHRAHAAPACGVGGGGARAGAGAHRQHPAPGHADPRAARGAAWTRWSWPR